MVKQKKIAITSIQIKKEHIADLSYIKYSLGLKNYSEVIGYLIEQEVARNNDK